MMHVWDVYHSYISWISVHIAQTLNHVRMQMPLFPYLGLPRRDLTLLVYCAGSSPQQPPLPPAPLPTSPGPSLPQKPKAQNQYV